MSETVPAESLCPGNVILVSHRGRDVRVTILRDQEACTEQVGPLAGDPRIRFWARREDTGREAWMIYGPGGVVKLESRA